MAAAMTVAAACSGLLCSAGAAAAAAHPPSSARGAPAGGTWGKAQGVPGVSALNVGGFAETESVSCAAPGDCTAGGFYGVPNSDRAFVVTETNGTWGRAEQVPGTAALNKGGDARVESVSCAAPGDCSAGGEYEARYSQQAFVVTQADGTWGTAEEVPGTAVLNTGRWAQVNSVSCAAPGECSAGGGYSRRGGAELGFVVDESHGVWGTAEQVAGLNAQEVRSVSCAAPGECSAVGDLYVVTEKHGVWGAAEQVPGLAALNTGGLADIDTVSCSAPGDCSAGGFYTNPAYQAFVVGQQHGVWGAAEEVRGTAETDGFWGELTSVSCAAPGDCSAGGYYNPRPRSSHTRAYVVSETAAGRS
jgi:hypothetical protein